MRDDDRPQWPRWVRVWVLPFIRDPALRPILLVILGHVALFQALAILSVLRHEGAFRALVLLMGSVLLLGWEFRISGRPREVSACVVLTWVVATGLAWTALQMAWL